MMKILMSAAAVTAVLAISHEAQAGITISDRRYWPREAAASEDSVRRPADALAAVTPSRPIPFEPHRYRGGPKAND